MGKSHRKGWEFEHLIEGLLKKVGYEVYRPRAGQQQDEGDLIGIPDWTIQCKNHKTMSLGAWSDQAKQQAVNGKTKWWCVIHNRRGKGFAGHQFVTMSVEQWLEIVQELENGH